MKTEPKDDAERALQEARRLEETGDYAGALEKHMWFHHNALAVRPSYYGVRLSFALSDWVELGRKYQPAMQKLKSIRDEKSARLGSGELERELFHDVVSINEYLGEQEKTVQLFKTIDGSTPEFASNLYDLADSALIESKDYVLARKHLGDAAARFARAKANFEDGMEEAKESRRDTVRQAHETIFASEVVRVITVLRETGDRDSAKKIQNDGLSVLNSPAIRDALQP